MQQFIARTKTFLSIFLISAKRYHAGEHNQRAVALTYYTLFAIVPVAALMFGIAKGFDFETKLRLVLDERFSQHRELLKYVYQFADTTLRQSSGGLVAGIGVIALIWTLMWLAGNIEKAFNAVWGLPPRKNILRKLSDYIAILLLTPVLLVILSSAGVFLRSKFEDICGNVAVIHSGVHYFTGLMTNLIPVLVVILVFSLIYYMAPNTKVRMINALFAGVFAGICFQLLQDGFILLQRALYRYNHIYGSFAILPLFLIWMQWSWQIALFGAEIGFVSQHIDTGMFDNERMRGESHRQKRILQISIARIIYRNFVNKCGATSGDELERRTGLPPVRLAAELAELEKAKIVLPAATESAAYLPGFPPETTTVAFCIQKLDTCSGTSESNANPEYLAAIKFFAESDETIAKHNISRIFEL